MTGRSLTGSIKIVAVSASLEGTPLPTSSVRITSVTGSVASAGGVKTGAVAAR